jgi:hypothetical protein
MKFSPPVTRATSWRRADINDQFLEFARHFQQYPGELERVSSAPWQEVVVDKDINLFELSGNYGRVLDKA